MLRQQARRMATGSLPAACATSSKKLSLKKALCECPTERQ
jgi:hypothetical protein